MHEVRRSFSCLCCVPDTKQRELIHEAVKVSVQGRRPAAAQPRRVPSLELTL